MPRLAHLPLWIVVAAYLALGSLYLRATPHGRTPDERAHVRTIAQIAYDGCCPELEISPTWTDYEDHQPPLYYILLAPLYRATEGDLDALRAATLLLGSGALFGAWSAMRALFPQQPWLALGVTGFIAFLPQRLGMVVGVNNDALAESLAAALLALCLWWLRSERHLQPLWIGTVLGVCFVTKLTLYPLTAAVAATLLLRSLRAERPWRTFWRGAIAIAVPAALIGGTFWLRNVVVYGFPDFLAQQRHDSLALAISGQPTREAWIARRGLTGWLEDLIGTTFQSFWGQFGEMAVPMQSSTYHVLHILTALALSGALYALFSKARQLSGVQWAGLIVLGTALLGVAGAFFYYNLKFVQFQGRYLYPALVPIALFYVSGAAGVGMFLRARVPVARRWLSPTALSALLSVGMAAFAIYALYRVLIPFLV
jgi:hypothetical protein